MLTVTLKDWGGESFGMTISCYSTIAALKAKIEEMKPHVPAAQQVLNFGDKQLREGKARTVEDNGIKNGDTLIVTKKKYDWTPEQK